MNGDQETVKGCAWESRIVCRMQHSRLLDTNFINMSIQMKLDIFKSAMECLLAKCVPCITDCNLIQNWCKQAASSIPLGTFSTFYQNGSQFSQVLHCQEFKMRGGSLTPPWTPNQKKHQSTSLDRPDTPQVQRQGQTPTCKILTPTPEKNKLHAQTVSTIHISAHTSMLRLWVNSVDGQPWAVWVLVPGLCQVISWIQWWSTTGVYGELERLGTRHRLALRLAKDPRSWAATVWTQQIQIDIAYIADLQLMPLYIL